MHTLKLQRNSFHAREHRHFPFSVALKMEQYVWETAHTRCKHPQNIAEGNANDPNFSLPSLLPSCSASRHSSVVVWLLWPMGTSEEAQAETTKEVLTHLLLCLQMNFRCPAGPQDAWRNTACLTTVLVDKAIISYPVITHLVDIYKQGSIRGQLSQPGLEKPPRKNTQTLTAQSHSKSTFLKIIFGC